MNRTIKPSILQNLVSSSLWNNKLKQDCHNQQVFFTVRENRIDFYHKGGLLFKFEGNQFKTHVKYAAVIDTDDDSINYLSENQLSSFQLATDFETNYERIKENCSKYSGVEAAGVSEIYRRHSFNSNNDVMVLDIEVSFQSEDENKKQDRIDVVLYDLRTRTIHFVEAKHFSNKEIFSTGRPKVINQLNRYKKQISKNEKENIKEYGSLIQTINQTFSKSIPLPVEVDEKVILLIFGFDIDQKNGRLQNLIMKYPEYRGTKIYAKGDITNINLSSILRARIL